MYMTDNISHVYPPFTNLCLLYVLPTLSPREALDVAREGCYRGAYVKLPGGLTLHNRVSWQLELAFRYLNPVPKRKSVTSPTRT